MEKKAKIVLFIPVVVFLITGIVLYLPYLESEPTAVLEIEKGSVEISKGSDWVKASPGTALKEGWSIRTSEDGEARIVFYGSAVARLEPEAEIAIRELDVENGSKRVYLEQAGGDVWYDLVQASGIADFRVETPDGIFADAGTSFGCSVAGIQSGSNQGTAKPPGTTISVTQGLVMRYAESSGLTMVDKNMQTTFARNGELSSQPLVRTGWVEKNDKASKDWIVKLREKLKKKYARNIAIAKPIYAALSGETLTNELLDSYIDRVLAGETDVNQMVLEGKIPKQYVYLVPSELVNARRPLFYVPKDVVPTPTKNIVPSVTTRSGETEKPLIYVPKDVVPTPTKNIVPYVTTGSAGGKRPLFYIPKDVVPNSNECSYGQLKQVTVVTKIEKKKLRGVESLKIKDWQGINGLSNLNQKEVLESTEWGLFIIKMLEKALLLTKAVLAETPLRLAEIFELGTEAAYIGYSEGMEHEMLEYLKKMQERGTFSGYPQWIEVEYGPVWERIITKTSKEKTVYSCKNGRWNWDYKVQLPDEYSLGNCQIVGSAGTYRYKLDLGAIDPEGRTRSDFIANALAKGFPEALKAAMKSVGASAVGKCSS